MHINNDGRRFDFLHGSLIVHNPNLNSDAHESNQKNRCKGQIPSERELIGCVGEVLKASQGFDILPHFDYILQKSPVLFLLTISQLPGVPAIFREEKHTIETLILQ